jgi:hypothetical protein
VNENLSRSHGFGTSLGTPGTKLPGPLSAIDSKGDLSIQVVSDWNFEERAATCNHSKATVKGLDRRRIASTCYAVCLFIKTIWD